jgi:hypothetical protein
MVFQNPPSASVRLVSWLCHDLFLPTPFQFVVPFYYSSILCKINDNLLDCGQDDRNSMLGSLHYCVQIGFSPLGTRDPFLDGKMVEASLLLCMCSFCLTWLSTKATSPFIWRMEFVTATFQVLMIQLYKDLPMLVYIWQVTFYIWGPWTDLLKMMYVHLSACD